MRAVTLLSLVILGGCWSCATTPTPIAQSVYQSLLDAGCLAPSDGGVAAIEAEHATGHDAWMNCMYDGGTVDACAVPCNR